MKVLLCLASAAGGIGTHVADLARSMHAAGHTVQVATDAATRARFDLPGQAPLTVAAVRELARGADVVHAHGFRAGLVSAVATGAVATTATAPPTVRRRRGGEPGGRVPLVVSLHNPVRGAGLSPRRLVGGLAARAVMRRADLVTGASSDLVTDALALGASRAELAEVPSPRVPALLATDRAAWRAKHRDALLAAHEVSGAPFVLTIARVAPQKGIDVLAAAADGAPGTWGLVGPGQETLTTGGALHLLGEAADVTPWLLAADVLVVPSEWEARALVVQEAMAAGTPVVARRVGGLPDLLDGVGLLVDGPQTEAAGPLAHAVGAVLHHPERAARTAEAARERARGWDGLESSATRWVLRYRALAHVT
ncbi:glycosyltransferase family 4 protein [Janibacter sp. CX7]|uniref:glycosyltransferase family 4 protein n=1 Tax=Janibacter sp. CX7 TaxID=2963431 RepID=UPI0020CC6561|nr:glycosyltransferase family 4 protein [Janibacter sp. CX7]UTT64875.1 glycosyltransferase family 4 protein [Janibacter sp. CX7]